VAQLAQLLKDCIAKLESLQIPDEPA